MHRAVSNPTTRHARMFASSSMLKRPVNARTRKVPRLPNSQANHNSTLALEQLARMKENSTKLSWDEMKQVMASAAVPMVGFGFMDNFVMIQAGSYIDSTLGVKFGLATLTAAAMGQVVSDVSGVVFGGTLDRLLRPWVKPAQLSAAQRKLAIVPRLRVLGAAIGVVIGCCLGASSLLFVLDSDPGMESDQIQQLHGIMRDMLICDGMAEMRCKLLLKSAVPTFDNDSVEISQLTGANATATRCAEERDHILDRNILHIPIKSSEDDIVAVLELSNEEGFSVETVETAQQFAKHVAIFMNRMTNE